MKRKTQFVPGIYSKRFALGTLLTLLLLLGLTNSSVAQTVLQGFKSDEKLQRGMLVALNDEDQSKIHAITNESISKLKGVVADANDSPVTLGNGEQQIFVATTGTYEVLVSNENGRIKQGDFLSGSSLAGIAMKADDSQSTIVGRAAQNFEGEGDSIGKSTLKDKRAVSFGRIKADLGVGDNPWKKALEKDKVPDALQEAARTVADKDVSAVRIYMSLFVFLVAAAIAGTTLFSGVRSTVISIGRNPLSKGIILRGLLQVLLLSLIIFLTGLFGVYLLIKL